jgi:Flp pilus assembly protein TadG
VRRCVPRAVGWPRGDRGALTLSYVVLLPFVLTFLMVVVQGSFWFLARQAALAAARQGADAARALHSSPAAGVTAALTFARHSGSGYLLNPQASTKGSTATTISVRVWGSVPSLVPGLEVSVSETVQAPVEEFRP